VRHDDSSIEGHVTSTRAGRFGPAPIIAIHVLAIIGVLFWLSTIVEAFIDNSSSKWLVAMVGLVLGGAHVAISRFTSLHSTRAFAAMWFVFVGDSLLAVFVEWQAIALVLFTIVLLLLTRARSARSWFASQM
jgi:hypothetical protein